MYRFFAHRHHRHFRLVLKEGDPFPEETTEAEWQQTLVRAADDTGRDVRTMIEERGYCLFQIGLTFDHVPPAPS